MNRYKMKSYEPEIQYVPILSAEFGWIYPVGGGTPAEDEAKAKAEAEAKVKAEAEAKAKAEAEEKKKKLNQDNADENADELAKLKKRNEELEAKEKKQEEKDRQAEIDKLDGKEKAEAEAKEEKRKREELEKKNKSLLLAVAVSEAMEKYAADGKDLIKEFLQPIDSVEEIDAMLEKAWKRQGEVMSDRVDPNLPTDGSGGGPVRKPKQVQGAEAALKTWQKYQDMVSQGDRTVATSKAWNKSREDLIAAGISPITGEAIKKD